MTQHNPYTTNFGMPLIFLIIIMMSSLIGVSNTDDNQYDDYIVPPVPFQKAPYAEWAHHHWVWVDHGRENQQVLLNLVNSYLSYDIPVGAIDIDSEWSTGINNFIIDKNKFPNMYQFVKTLHSMNIKVICWVTSVVDEDSSNYKEGFDKGYFLNSGRTVKWWHGHGSFIDYSNPDALNWWHSQMNNLLILNESDKSVGIDGWKCDGTDPYVFEFVYIYGHKGHISEREYANMYYRDFFYYTRQVRGDDALIMARPVDSYFGYLYLDFAPRDVVFSGWVGDQDPTFEGLQNAIKNMFHSAWNKYVSFGTDIAGYRGGGKRDLSLYIRWFQMGAFNGLMENGGNGVHEPWGYDTPTLNVTNLYRKYVHIHYELNPYLYSAGIDAYSNHKSIMGPLASYTMFTPEFWSYTLGDSILVTPMVDSTPKVTVFFPKGKWVDYFNHDVIIEGGQIMDLNYSTYDQFPVFYKAGSILPMNITTNHVNLFGNSRTNRDYLTIAIHYPTENTEQVQNIQSHGIQVKYIKNSFDNTLRVSISAPNSFRKDYKNMKFLLDIRGMVPSSSSGYKITQYSFYQKNYVSLQRFDHLDIFNLDRQSFGSFVHMPISKYTVTSINKQVVDTQKHQPVLIKLHDVIRGVKLVIQ